MLAINIDTFQYDIGIQDGFDKTYYDKFFEFDRTALIEYGHLEYILRIYSTGALLETNMHQAYHPPLNHLISAGFIKILDFFGASNEFKIEALEFPPFIYSICILLVAYKIMKEIGLNKKQTIIPMAIIAFHPLFIFMSRLINNDQLVTLFTLISVLYLLKWYKVPNYKNTLILALSIGLGGMAKTSIIVMVIPLIFTYMKKLAESIDDSKIVKKILIQGLLFSLISLPLLFWYPLRNAIKFGQAPFSIATALDTLKVANTNFSARWIINGEIFNNLLLQDASNVWAYVINSSIMFMIEATVIPNNLSLILRILSLLLIVISIIGIFKLTKKDNNKNLLYILIATYLAWIIGFIYFNISLPYSCTMHARYIVVSMLIGIIYIGMFYNNLENSLFKNILKIIITLFVVISIIFVIYLVIKIV